jgi:small-conductance mechanosensitive channel
MNDETEASNWNLDKRVPIALILAILAQTAAGVWWAASQTARLDTQERRVTMLESNDNKMAEAQLRAAEALASIKASQDAMRSSLDRIERTIDSTRRP